MDLLELEAESAERGILNGFQAAYRLGVHARPIWALMVPSSYMGWDDDMISSSWGWSREAISAICDVIPHAVQQELIRLLDAMERAMDDLRALEISIDEVEPSVEASTNWGRYQSLVRRAIPRSDALHPFLVLGLSLGEYAVALQGRNAKPRLGRSCGAETFPDFGPVRRALEMLLPADGSGALRQSVERLGSGAMPLPPILRMQVMRRGSDEVTFQGVFQSVISRAQDQDHQPGVSLAQECDTVFWLHAILCAALQGVHAPSTETLPAAVGSIEQSPRLLESPVEGEVAPSAVVGMRRGLYGLILDPDARTVRRDGYGSVRFNGSQRAWELLVELSEETPKYHPREALTRAVWGEGEIEESTFDGYISDLRKRIRPLGLTIETARNVGYELVEADKPS